MSAGSSQHYRTLEELHISDVTIIDPARIEVGVETYTALIEAKQIHQFDPAFATYRQISKADRQAGNPRLTSADERLHLITPTPRFWSVSSVVEEMYEAKE
jgi:hypothetical protein